MSSDRELNPTACAICGWGRPVDELFPASLRPGDLRPSIFSARREADRIHYRLVRCRSCGLVRSDPVADPGVLHELYAASSFDYGAEAKALRQTYGRYLAMIGNRRGDRLLEIGAGNGFFLEVAIAQGYGEVVGVEPSSDAISQAAPAIRPALLRDSFREGLFEAARFDVICLFQVFDHLSDPALVLDECRRIMRPGGRLLIFNHDVESWSARLLGERSPIFDIEHTYLYSRTTLRRLLEQHGFRVRGEGRAWNSYRLGYLVHLLPVSGGLRRGLMALARLLRLSERVLTVPLGNLYAIAEPA